MYKKLFPVAALFITGCVGHADVMLAHPLATKSELPPSKETEIEKPAAWAESTHGLPQGTLTQRARLTKLDEREACFAVQLNGLRPDLVDARQLRTVLKDQPSGTKIERAQVTPGTASERTYTGLVEHREQTGVETYCASRNSDGICTSWQSRALYSISMVPGSVTVYTSSSQLCFDHNGVVNTKTQRVILDLHKIEMVGFMPQKIGAVDFRWGLSGALKD